MPTATATATDRPRTTREDRRRRDLTILRRLARGMSKAEAARRANLSRQQLYNRLAEMATALVSGADD